MDVALAPVDEAAPRSTATFTGLAPKQGFADGLESGEWRLIAPFPRQTWPRRLDPGTLPRDMASTDVRTPTRAASVTWQEMRSRAAAFVKEWRDESRERAEKDTFWTEFLSIFGVSRRRVAVFEAVARKQSTGRKGFVDMLWAGHIAVEHKSRGENLDAAMHQLLDYMSSLSESELPALLVECDFASFRVHDLENKRDYDFSIDDLPKHLELFAFLAGYNTRPKSEAEEDVNLKATKILAQLHDALRSFGYDGHPLRVFMVRILFILFADDTQVWERGLFDDYLRLKTTADGRDVGPALALLFQVLDTPSGKRQRNIDDDLAAFAHINGELFHEHIPIPVFDREMREKLLDCSRFNWSVISPAIFGSLFQEVMLPAERRSLGAHYTTEINILRTIRPLFVEELEAELSAASTGPALRRFQDKLGSLTFFDPACGCGNFLVIAYREIRRLELECLKRLRKRMKDDNLSLDVRWESKVHVGQFYGIEIEEFPARIAETAMYLMDHLANLELSSEIGAYYVRFPITDTPHVRVGNALRIDWNSILPATRCNFLFGNPPFVGQTGRSAAQTDDLRYVWGAKFSRWLDYVTAWFEKASSYIAPQGGKTDQRIKVRVAFVATNSITQGEQVARAWRPLLDNGMVIDFAHRTFKWTSEAAGKAHVHCVIVGFSHGGWAAQKRLFQYPDAKSEPIERRVPMINPYLIARPNILVTARSTPIGYRIAPASYGNKPSDGGHLVVNDADLPRADPIAMKFIRKYVGAEELIDAKTRWCIWIGDGEETSASKSRFIRTRVEAVREFRERSSAADTRKLADRPYRFFRTPQPTTSYIAIPRHVSETRRWFTVLRLPASVIASDALFTAPDADGLLFALLSSSMFIAWLRTVGGALKSDLRFSQLVHNSFPFPETSENKLDAIRAAGAAVEAARAAHKGVSLGQLYDTEFTPADVVAAHRRLDAAVDAAFAVRKRSFSDSERVEVLFDKYLALVPQGQPDGSAIEEEDE